MPTKAELKELFKPAERKPVLCEVEGFGKFYAVHPTVAETGMPTTMSQLTRWMEDPAQVARLVGGCVVTKDGNPLLTEEEALEFARTAHSTVAAQVINVIMDLD